MGLEDILQFPRQTHSFGSIDSTPALWIGTANQIHRVPSASKAEEDVQHSQDVLSISPSGRNVVRLLPISYIRPEWNLYNPMAGFESWRIRANDPSQIAPEYWFRLREYMLTDTQTGRKSTLIDGPNGDSLAVQDRSLAVWSPDGKRVLLGNVALPLNGVDESEKQRRLTTCAVADIEIATHKVDCVVFSRDAVNVGLTAGNPHPLRLHDASWNGNAEEITLRFSWHDKWGQVERYRRIDGKWVLRDVTPVDPMTVDDSDNAASSTRRPDHLTLSIEQSLNTPPALWATDTRTTQSKLFWNPNPQLNHMSFGKASLYHWTDKTGYASAGILVLPTDYRPGVRYPLVIQTHGVWENIFITDGSYTTAMAARPLASAGIVVLQTQWNATHFSERQEASDQVEMFDAAIAQLSKDGIIDERKVGIIGFSRTVGHVEQALISHPERYAAATIADGMDVGYMQYMLFAEGRSSLAKEYERIVGEPPVGNGLSTWIDYSPSFHVDKVKTPLRIEATDPSSILTMWETYAALRRLHRPVDLIYIDGAQHILQRPLDRMASEQGNVDWFRFWLQGFEDPDPTKSKQYARWQAWRSMQ
jgi:dipeptidyl aminopeptidase/acylaminoacyl peptidase